MYLWWNVPAMKCPCDEVSLRWSVPCDEVSLAMKWVSDEVVGSELCGHRYDSYGKYFVFIFTSFKCYYSTMIVL